MRRFLGLVLFILLAANCGAQLSISANLNQGCAPVGIILSVDSPDPATIAEFDWEVTLPDNSIETSSSAEFIDIFTQAGSYSVTLTINGNETVVEQDFIEIFPNPQADFAISEDSGCFPLCTQFTDLSLASGGTIVEWSWDFGNGITSTDQNPSYCYQSAGNYFPILSIENEFGCFSDITLGPITVLDDFPTADFTPSTLADCNPPSDIAFVNNSVGTGQLTCEWTFDDGFSQETVEVTDINHIFNAVDFYNVCLNVIDTNGCEADSCIQIEVFPAPLPEFNVSSLLSCAELPLDFNSTTSPTPTQVSWDFDGDGVEDSTQDTVSWVYDNPGTFNPILTATYSPGCQASTDGSIEVEILDAIHPSFVADTTFGCTVPLEVNFTNTSSGSGILSFSWLIDGVEVSNSEDYTHTFTNLGSYDVELVVSNDSGCEASYDMVEFVNINSATIDFNLPTVVCTEELVELTNFDVDSYDPVILLEWDFDEDDLPDGLGDNPNFTYDTPGEYVVSVVVTTENGCVSEVESSATILVQPNAEAVIDSGETMSCAGEPVEFCVQTVEGLNYNWNFGDNTGWSLIEFPINCIQHDYQDTGYFDITLSVYNLACGTQLLLEDYLYISGPVALFEAEEDCSDPTLVSFQSNSIEATELIWDFGDGSPLVYNVENPTHQYAAEGNYTVTLTVSNPDIGCPDIATVNVNLFTDPIALNFIPNEGCPGMNVFMNSPDQTQYEVWNIDFGNGSSLESTWNAGLNRWEVYTYTPEGVDYSLFSFNANFIPFINYSSAGYFDIVIETVDWSGCQNSTTYDDAIWVYNDFYFADFDINVIEECDSVHVEFVPTGDLLDTWEWELTDGSIVNDYTFEHVFTAPYDTTFGATFSAIDDFGCANQVSKAVDITPPPIPAFSVLSDPSCLGEEIVLQNESIGDDITFLWDFGDPASGPLNTSSETQPSHTFNANGSYTVCLDATNVDGCTQTLCLDDLVNIVNPVATADYVAGINNCLYGVTFDNTTAGNIQSSIWNFGDDQSGGGINVFHTYPLGVYDAELIVINEFGCSDTLLLNDILNLGDVVGPYSVTLDNITCAPFQTTFDSYNTSDNSFTYFWEFDDGNGDANNNNSTNHTYDTPGEYCPSLIMEDQNGCTVFIQCEDPFVVEEFTFETTLPEPVCFGNTMPVVASGASSYAWSDDSNIVTNNDSTWVADFDQTQNLQLTGYYEDCESVVDVEFLVYQLPVVDLPIQNEVCFDEEDILFDMGTPNLDGVGVYYVESVIETEFDTGMPANQSYEVVYAFTDVNGCYSADTSQVLINPLPIVDLPDFDDHCISEEVLIFNSGTPIGGEYFVNDILSPDFNPALGEGVYSIDYTYVDGNGCSGSADNEIQVNPLPVPAFVADDLCYGEFLLVENNSDIPNGTIDTHEWDFGGIQTSLMENPNLVDLGVPGVYNVQLINTSAEGCQDSLTQQVQVLTSPEVDFTIEDDCLAELFNFTDLSEVIGGTIDQWEWRIDGTPVSLDQNVGDYQFANWGSYEIQLVAVSNEACADSMSQVLQVHAMPTPDFSVEEFCADVNAELNNFSSIENGSIDQFVWNAGDGSAVQNELNFNHIYNAPGFYPVTLTATSDQGCEESIEQVIQVFAAPEIQVGQDAFADCGLAQVNFEDFSSADGSSIVSWQWTMNGELISGLPTAIFNPDGPGSYDIELLVSSAQGCLSDTVITNAFEVYPHPSIDYVANPDQVTMLSPELNISDQTVDAIFWEFSLPNGDQIEASEIDYLFTDPGQYHFDLYVENEFGCGDSTRIFIDVVQEILVHIPNAFTPDGDGLNEVFVPVLNDIDVEEYEFEIYNRWGEVIFTTDQPGKGWKGDVRNGDYFAQNGVYTYKLILTETTLSDTREFTGHVTLLR